KPTTTVATPEPVVKPAPEANAPAEAQAEQVVREVDRATGEVLLPDAINELATKMVAWHDVTRWLEHNGVDPDKVGPLCQEHFGSKFESNRLPEYFKWVALQLDDLKAQYPLQTQYWTFDKIGGTASKWEHERTRTCDRN
ncbi:MAG: hypothetical protein HN975_03705, partial [Anaerolineae bacterium]|nr:hypothetical protein [Anaerolineae bacterium]